MKKTRNIFLAGIITGFVFGILIPITLFSSFITGDSVWEFIEDGGSIFLVITYYSILGIIIGGIVSFIISKISRFQE
ncbi:MAG: hypothetical protein COY66_03795 [Candidatus Kerfeldbacteria bacterium CG_4_10_14_0_8_um_filter_42_10]|uniref:Uncharacterized protein n=1 Tax=Candidatus Kerfeldbacteria bacterium CG_4_10_14_0_8_um_filter_42_10 TaxID=2014248 RepID=A0A2M7RIP6_9BACT|nr:MAG: hypothetical protein COY66_03795 [Candidatus Kerfeldbacteria bacterium CG_4_10_14_0_8_um_filter_42_10]